MINANYIFLPLTAFVISILVNKFLLLYLHRKGVLDVPNERSSHKDPTPRGGGIGIVLGVSISALAYAAISADIRVFIIVLISFIIGLVGWIDDVKKGLHTGLRIAIQFICSVSIIYFLNPIDLLPLPLPLHIHMYYYGIIISIIWLMGITNIFNFLDGIDGYAGLQGFIGGLILSIITWGSAISIIGLLIAMACAGFLLFNWHPARIFMGDVGSSFLGFLFASLPFYFKDHPGSEIRSNVFFATAIFLWFFLLDGTFTIFRRIFKKEKIWKAHRSHLYQRLVISGMSHSEVVLTISFFYTLLILALLFYFCQPGHIIIQWPILIIGFILFLFYIFYTLYRERKAGININKEER